MQEANINIAEMTVGQQFTLKDEDVLNIKYLTTLMTKPTKDRDSRGNPIEPQPYARMRFGSIAFTINTPEDVDIVSDPEKRDDIYSMTLEVSNIAEPRLDAETGNPVLDGNNNPIVDNRKGLTFVSLQTYTSKTARDVKRITNEGAQHAERVKYGLDKPIASVDDIAAKVAAKLAAAKPVAAEAPATED